MEILNRETRSAEARLLDARKAVDAIIAEPPGMLPNPDGIHRFSTAIRERLAAREVLELALKRNAAFSLGGIVPDDLK
jgi:hypothetical protein